MSNRSTRLCHPLLEASGVSHGFGIRGAPEPEGLRRARQAHGNVVAELREDGVLTPAEADAVVSSVPGTPVAVVTADCVPILAAATDGSTVVAIHAGWRGLAAGVVEAGIEALRLRSREGTSLVAVVGPHIGPCCYEVDAPVLDAMTSRFGERAHLAWRSGRPGHAQLDLAALVELALERVRIPAEGRGRIPDACTACDPDRFHSYRRDGARAGRLIHHVAAENPELRGVDRSKGEKIEG